MATNGHPATALHLHDIRQRQRADGPAAMLGIGTANPTSCVLQDQFADWYFHVTKSDHLAELKTKIKKFVRTWFSLSNGNASHGMDQEKPFIVAWHAGDRSGIKKRYFYHTEEIINGHPELIDGALPSLTTRLGIAADAAPKLAAEAATRAIAAWGRPAADITHLVMATNAGASEPGADLRLVGLLGLRPTVRRTMLYLHGCSAGLVALRVAKDIAENNRGARVLVACAQVQLLLFVPPDYAHIDLTIAMTLFSNGAGAVIVGADPVNSFERPIFHMVSASQTTLPGTEKDVTMNLRENGLVNSHLSAEEPKLVRGSIKKCLADSLAPLGLLSASDDDEGRWNGLFWALHPGGRAILDSYEAALRLEPAKLAASRHVLSEYGNMMGTAIIFVLDEMRRRCRRDDGKDCQWGVMSGLGPGLNRDNGVAWQWHDQQGEE